MNEVRNAEVLSHVQFTGRCFLVRVTKVHHHFALCFHSLPKLATKTQETHARCILRIEKWFKSWWMCRALLVLTHFLGKKCQVANIEGEKLQVPTSLPGKRIYK